MKGKSWQRFALALLLVLGYFGVLIYALVIHDTETVKQMVPALPPMIVAVTSVWVHQAGTEKKENGGHHVS